MKSQAARWRPMCVHAPARWFELGLPAAYYGPGATREDIVMSLRASILACAALLLVPFSAFAGDTVVVAAGNGSYKPGLAKSWTAEGDKVTFVLADGTDANQLATFLRDRLAQAKVSVEAGKLVVAGIPMPALLEQLSTLSPGGDADPLAALAGLGGGAPTAEGPEAGGSIRASKPTPIATLLGTAPEPATADRLEADGVDVTRGPFPQVVLKLKLRRAVTAGPLKGKLAQSRLVEVPVLLAGPKGEVDYSQPATQRNLAGFFLKKGDRVAIHAVEVDGGQIAVDWIERR